jgi:hypothetical protein
MNTKFYVRPDLLADIFVVRKYCCGYRSGAPNRTEKPSSVLELHFLTFPVSKIQGCNYVWNRLRPAKMVYARTLKF